MEKRLVLGIIAPFIALVAMADATPQGALAGLFSVSETKQVQFAQGNLQYQASTNTWQFATNQWDCIGAGNIHISSSYTGWIDLFGWGTSGYHDAADALNTHFQPWENDMTYDLDKTNNNTGYGPSFNAHAVLYPELKYYDLAGSIFANYDWGVYNQISNGGDKGAWRVLTQSEWLYLINTRANAVNLRCMVTIEDVYGLVILPDGSSVSPSSVTTSSALANAQAVFLPAAGYRGFESKTAGGEQKAIYELNTHANYWTASATEESSLNAYCLDANSSSILISSYNRFDGFSVRLVYDPAPQSWITVSDRPANETAQNTLLTSHKTAAKPINVHLKRTLYSDGWNTLCLPFTLTNEEWKAAFGADAQVAKFTSATLSKNKDTLNITMTSLDADEEMSANVPYIIVPTTDVVNSDFINRTITVDAGSGEAAQEGEAISFVGIINRYQLTPGDKKYLFVTATDELDWSKPTDTGKMYGLRGYFYVPGMEEAKIQNASARMVVRQAPAVVTEIQNVQSTIQKVRKVIVNGQILITRDNNTYSVTGQRKEVQL